MGYRILETDDIPGYLRERGHWDDATDIGVREVSDGNMNRVFLASSADGTRSLAVKQALPWVRVAGPSWPMSQDRADAEARAYDQVAKVAPDKIPAIHGYDPENHALVMEDMSDLEVLRTRLDDAHLTDLTTLPDPVPASRRALLLGRELITRREELTDVDAVRVVVEPLA